MSQYRDQLDAALARIETLEAKLHERDAAVVAREAELSEMRGEMARMRGSDRDAPFDALDARAGQRALLVALAVCGFATATGYAMVRPHRCVHRGASMRAHATQVQVSAVSAVPDDDVRAGVGAGCDERRARPTR